MSGQESPPPEDNAHDVLAAEEFGMPAADPSLRHQPITLPDDPTGIAEPHDVLAAEEFAMPATHRPSGPAATAGRIATEAASPGRIAVLAAVAVGVLRGLRRRRRA
jgi:MYXO-CTERM domain-containing protein